MSNYQADFVELNEIIQPLYDTVLVKSIGKVVKNKTASGILLPGQSDGGAEYLVVEVLKVGTGYGKDKPLEVAVGDKVLLAPNVRLDLITLANGDQVALIKEVQVLAKVA